VGSLELMHRPRYEVWQLSYPALSTDE
jgi:hypothetical protein